MLALLTLNNIKTVLIFAAIAAAIWFFKDYQHQKSENHRQSANIAAIRMQDSLRFASQIYTKKELNEFLAYNRQDLQKFLEENKIKTRNIEKIITQKLAYIDGRKEATDLQPILQAIKNNTKIKVPVIDSTKCLVVKGWVLYDGDSLKLNITSRTFKNRSDVVSYVKRNQWKFLGIKTRLFGRRKTTVIIKDDCGKTETFIIDKKK